MSETSPSIEDKQDVAEKLEGLKKVLLEKGVTDENVMAQLAEIEKASKEGAQQPTLTHKTINQLQKTEKQLSMLKVQIMEMDDTWMKWQQMMKAKYVEQGGLYKEKRGALQERYKELKEKQKALRLEVQRAALQAPEVKEEEKLFVPPDIPVFDLEDASMMSLTVSSSEDEKDTTTKPRKTRERDGAAGTAAASPSKMPKLGSK